MKEGAIMSTAILYYSKHHGNTKKLLDAIAAAHDVTLIDVTKEKKTDLSMYDRIGLASGIYAGNLGKPLLTYAEENLPEGMPVFFLYTSAMGAKTKFPKAAEALIAKKRGTILGKYACQGYNTFGPFKIIGGTAKGHPTKEELAAAVSFYEGLRGRTS